jgi:hypothetical protein
MNNIGKVTNLRCCDCEIGKCVRSSLTRRDLSRLATGLSNTTRVTIFLSTAFVPRIRPKTDVFKLAATIVHAYLNARNDNGVGGNEEYDKPLFHNAKLLVFYEFIHPVLCE